MKKTITTIAAIAAVVALAGCGAGKAHEAVANAPRPTVTVTKPAPPAVTTTVQSVPQACLDALDNADTAISTAGEGFGIVSDAFIAASNFDAAGIDAATAKLAGVNKVLSPQLTAYATARDACKAAKG